MPQPETLPADDLPSALRLICSLAAAALDVPHVLIALPERGLRVWNHPPEPPPGMVEIAGSELPGADGRLCAFAPPERNLDAGALALMADVAALAAARVRSDGADRDLVPATARGLARFGHWQLERATGRATWSDETLRLLGYGSGRPTPTFAMALAAFPSKAQTEFCRGITRTVETGEEVSIASSLKGLDGRKRDVLVRFRAAPAPEQDRIDGIMLDVTDARAFDERLQREKDLLQATLDHMDQGLIVVEPDLSVPVLSKRVTELLCLPPEFAETRPSFVELLKYQHETGAISLDTVTSSINFFVTNRDKLPRTHVYERETFDGKVLEVRTAQLPDGGFVRTFTDATERKRVEERIAQIARHDGLTGLPNRLLFGERLEAALRRGGLALLCLDLDRFKIVNDTMGHPAGDALLRALARRLSGLLADGQTIARLGGDEFAVLMPGSDGAAAQPMAAALIAALREPVDIEGRPITAGASIGIAVAPRDGSDPTQLMKCADLALYRAKAEGRGTFRCFAPEMDEAMQARQRLELDLRDALDRSEFRMLYQPMVRLADRTITGYEALLRWSHPEHGDIPPETFIAIAEETGMILPIGDWVLSRACTDATSLPGSAEIAVNVSTVELARPDFEARLTGALAASGLAPGRLVLEITETALIDLRIDIGPLLARLRARGIRTALDDFGTGYSSLGYLRRFAFDILKIDRSFALDLAEPETAAIVETLLALGRRLGIATIAEGIETEAQLAALDAVGCCYGQGHLFGAPRTLDAILA